MPTIIDSEEPFAEAEHLDTARAWLARAMEEGYQQEAESPSLDPEWATVEADGL